MKKLLLILPLVVAVAGCETRNGTTLAGAATGAAIGASVSSDDDKVQGALVGATAGAIAGDFVGRTNAGTCVYQRADGSRFTATCP